jgi:hypothetical protein
MAWGPKEGAKPQIDVTVDEYHFQIYEDGLAGWVVIELNIYDNETKDIHTERLVAPSYAVSHLTTMLPQLDMLYRKSRER